MAQPQITLYVDIVSPFAYMAYYVLSVSKVADGYCSVCHAFVLRAIYFCYPPILFYKIEAICDSAGDHHCSVWGYRIDNLPWPHLTFYDHTSNTKLANSNLSDFSSIQRMRDQLHSYLLGGYNEGHWQSPSYAN